MSGMVVLVVLGEGYSGGWPGNLRDGIEVDLRGIVFGLQNA